MANIPEKPSVKNFILRIVAGIVAGITGSLLILVIYLLTSAYIQPLIAGPIASEEAHPMFVFIFMVAVFVAILLTDVVGCFLMGMFVKERYTNLGEAVSKILFLNLLIFVLMIPLYIAVANIDLQFLLYVIVLQVFLSAQASLLTLEVVSNSKYAVIGIYSSIIAIMLSAGVLFLIYKSTSNTTALLFAIFPAVWFFMSFSHALLALIYSFIADASGKDFLAIEGGTELKV